MYKSCVCEPIASRTGVELSSANLAYASAVVVLQEVRRVAALRFATRCSAAANATQAVEHLSRQSREVICRVFRSGGQSFESCLLLAAPVILGRVDQEFTLPVDGHGDGGRLVGELPVQQILSLRVRVRWTTLMRYVSGRMPSPVGLRSANVPSGLTSATKFPSGLVAYSNAI